MLAVNGAQIFYEWLGDGDLTLTLVNGYTRPSSDFRMFARRLEKRGIRCLLLDNRGAGKSTTTRDFQLTDMVSDIQAIWEHEGVDHSAVLGISMGGMLAQSLALTSPASVDKLVLVSTACRSTMVKVGDIAWSADVAEVMAKMRPYFSTDFLQRNKLLVESMVKQIAKAVDTTDFVARARLQKTAIAGFDVCAQLNTLRLPTLIIHGQEDGVVPFAGAEILHSAIRDSRLHAFPGCGHLLLAEKPNELATLVADFIVEDG